MESMGIQPTYNLADRGNGYGCDGFGGGWFWVILILLFAGGGFWGNNNGVQDNFISSEFIKRDIFNTNQNVSSTGCQTQRDVLESRYTNQLGLQNLGQQMSNCCCDLKAEGFKNTCDITTAIHSEGEATRALINANTMQELRDRLADRDRELMAANLTLQNNAQTQTLINTLQPVAKPAYITCSPYAAMMGCGYNCGCSNV